MGFLLLLESSSGASELSSLVTPLGAGPSGVGSRALATKSVGCAAYVPATLDIASGIDARADDGMITSTIPIATEAAAPRIVALDPRPAGRGSI